MKVAIIMGSISDRDIAKKCADKLKEFGVEFEQRVMSAHRSLDLVLDFVEHAQENGIEVIIAFAGKAAHLGGVLAGASTLPVIGVPVKSSTLDGMDALLSTVQMPAGVPVATVAIDGAENAAILATQILAVKYDVLKEKLKEHKLAMKAKVMEMDRELNA